MNGEIEFGRDRGPARQMTFGEKLRKRHVQKKQLFRQPPAEKYCAYREQLIKPDKHSSKPRTFTPYRSWKGRPVKSVLMSLEQVGTNRFGRPDIYTIFHIFYATYRTRKGRIIMADVATVKCHDPLNWKYRGLYQLAMEGALPEYWSHDHTGELVKSNIHPLDAWSEVECPKCIATLDPDDKPKSGVWHCTVCNWTGSIDDSGLDNSTRDTYDPAVVDDEYSGATFDQRMWDDDLSGPSISVDLNSFLNDLMFEADLNIDGIKIHSVINSLGEIDDVFMRDTLFERVVIE